MRVEATKFSGRTTKFLVGSTQIFGSADQKFGCLNPHYFLVGLNKNEGQPDQNFFQPNQIAQM